MSFFGRGRICNLSTYSLSHVGELAVDTTSSSSAAAAAAIDTSHRWRRGLVDRPRAPRRLCRHDRRASTCRPCDARDGRAIDGRDGHDEPVMRHKLRTSSWAVSRRERLASLQLLDHEVARVPTCKYSGIYERSSQFV